MGEFREQLDKKVSIKQITDNAFEEGRQEGMKDMAASIYDFHIKKNAERIETYGVGVLTDLLLTKEPDDIVKAMKSQKDILKFGDEVIGSSGEKGIVVSKDNKGAAVWLLMDGYRVPQSVSGKDYRKTGKHYAIEEMVKGLKND